MTKHIYSGEKVIGKIQIYMPREEEIIEASQLQAKAYQKPFLDGAIWADSHPYWIGVEDMLPPERGTYLAATKTKVCEAEYYPDMVNPWRTPVVPIGEIVGVTHWKPLPILPPKKRKRGK